MSDDRLSPADLVKALLRMRDAKPEHRPLIGHPDDVRHIREIHPEPVTDCQDCIRAWSSFR